MNRRPLPRLLFAVAVIIALTGVGGGDAHAEPNLLAKSKPGIDEQLDTAPTQLDLFFSQKLTTPPTVTMEQTTPANAGAIQLGAPTQGKTTAEWIYPITIPLSPGVFSITLTGAVNTSSRFTIKGTAAATPGAVPSTAAPTTTVSKTAPRTTIPLTTAVVTVPPGAAVSTVTTAPPSTSTKTDAVHTTSDTGSTSAEFVGALGRWLTYLGLSALFGGLLLIAMAWPEGVDYVLTVRFFRLAWLAALVGSILTLVSLTAITKGTGVGNALSPSSWFDIKSNGEGLAAIARLLFVAGAAWVAFGPERAVAPASQLPAFAFPFLALVTYGFSRSTGAKLVPVGVVAGGLHVLAVAAWLGGLLLLSRVALTAPGDADLVRAVRGFSRIAVPALLLVVATGAVQVFRLVGGPAKLFSSGYGRLLLLKVFVVALMAYVATANRHVVRLRLGRAAQLNDRIAYRLRRSIAGEATIGMVVLVLSALMMNLVPAGLSASASSSNAGVSATETVTFKQSGLDATVGVGPSVAGVNNTIRITVRSPGTTSLIDIHFDFYPVSGVGTPFRITPPVDALKGGAMFHFDAATFTYLDPATNTSKPAPGTWQIIVAGHTQIGDVPDVTKTFTVAAASDGSGGSTTSTTTPSATAQPPNSDSTGKTTATSS